MYFKELILGFIHTLSGSLDILYENLRFEALSLRTIDMPKNELKCSSGAKEKPTEKFITQSMSRPAGKHAKGVSLTLVFQEFYLM